MRRKPAKHSCVELLPSSIHSAAMTSKRYLPQNDVSRIMGACDVNQPSTRVLNSCPAAFTAPQ